MTNNKIRFGPFELDVKAGELSRSGRRVRLQEKPLRLLQALVEQAGEVVSRDELRARLWPTGIVVEFDNGLNNAANKLRAVLGDSASSPKYVETVGRRGYRFVGALVDEPVPVLTEPAARASLPADSPPAGHLAADGAPASGASADRSASAAAPARHRKLWPLGVAAAVLVAAIAGGLSMRERPSSHEPRIESLAVLPLANLSSDPEQEYFSDGMTDTLISQLTGIRSLRVISRQSIMRYKESATPMPAIARELDVQGIIEGTVLRTADRVRVSVQLIHAPSDRHLWSEQYEGSLDDVLGLQARIARAVAAEVRATVTPQESERLARPGNVDAEAYDLYLRGRYFWALRTEAGLLRSLEYFERAIAIAPDFARAHAAIAEAYGPLGYNGMVAPDVANPRMRAAAERSLALDPNLVEGLTALGACAAFHEWKWAEGEQHFKRALAVSSNYSTAFGWYGQLLENLGRQPENLAARERAFELDPLWVGTGAALGTALFYNGRSDDAIAMLERTLELDPSHPIALTYLGRVYEEAGRLDEAIDAFARADNDGALGHAYGVAGRRDEALAALERLERRARERYVPPFQLALVRVGLGDYAGALDDLERGYVIHDTGMSGIKVDPRFEPLAASPRFVALLDRMGLR
jgi:TolB-like protein/DNA-binding winged helix-turn-helix (wHTH) protein